MLRNGIRRLKEISRRLSHQRRSLPHLGRRRLSNEEDKHKNERCLEILQILTY
jgi:hypothetical protein